MKGLNGGTVILGVRAERIAAAIEGEIGTAFDGSYDALLAIGQAMWDMTECGYFGKDLETVLSRYFTKGTGSPKPVCLRAVEDVFIRGKRRNPDWRIYRICIFDKGILPDGTPDFEKLVDLFESYDYLGTDLLGGGRGLVYFGRKKLYRVQVGAGCRQAQAQALYKSLKNEGFDACLVLSGRCYRVRIGRFYSRENAEDCKAHLKAQGYEDAFVTACF